VVCYIWSNEPGYRIAAISLCLYPLILLCLSLPAAAFAQAHPLPRIFIALSYDAENLISQPQEEGLIAGLEDAGFVDGKTVRVKRFYMDTQRTYTRPDQITSRGSQALEALQQFHPDLVITVDDNAARTVMLSLIDTQIPVVFTGINTLPEHYNVNHRFMENRLSPGQNVTGVYEKLYIDKSMQLMEEIIPDLRKVVFIVDGSPTGNAIKTQMETELFLYGSPPLYTIRQVSTFAEYK